MRKKRGSKKITKETVIRELCKYIVVLHILMCNIFFSCGYLSAYTIVHRYSVMLGVGVKNSRKDFLES